MTESIQGLQIPCHLVRTSLEKVKKNCTTLREKMNACVRMIKKKKKDSTTGGNSPLSCITVLFHFAT